MPGVRPPQPPPTGPSSNFQRRRRNSLPALSSSQLNKLSANAANATKKSKNPSGDGKTLSKSLPDDVTRKSDKTEKGKASSQPADKDSISSEQYGSPWDQENNNGALTNDDVPPHTSNSPLGLPNKTQSRKTNAVYIFRFEDDEEKSKDSSTTTNPKSPPVRDDVSPSSGLEPEPSYRRPELSQTWPFESVEERNSYILLRNAVRFNTTEFCGYKHKQFRESGKSFLTMSPVMELKTPISDLVFDPEDEWSMSSMIDYSNGSYSPRLSRDKRRPESLKLNANSNLLLKSDSNVKTLSSNLRSALSLSPRRASSSRTLTGLKDLNKKNSNRTPRPQSPQRLKKSARRGSFDSAVGQIFNNLKSTSSSSMSSTTSKSNSKTRTVPTPSASSLSSTSSSTSSGYLSSSQPTSSSPSSLSSRLSPPDDPAHKSKPTSPLPPRLLARRKSLSALPDLVQAREAEASVLRRGSINAASSDPMVARLAEAARTASRKP